ncbi:hypothetical protein J3R82DRAFT_6783 [Butyriboletus roseoflavus]|nr:hypothetical protein J3R82DRAFT_6783 [Butyriboletus roseoflavus]
MWKDSLVARVQKRPASWIAQSAPLIFSKDPRPVSTASLEPVQEQDDDDGKSRGVPSPRSHPDRMPVTATSVDEKATPPSILVVPPPPKDIHDIESNNPSRMRTIKTFLMEDIDTAQAAVPLTAYCFMTGFIDAVSFSAVFVWCAFQTGNSVQLALALARLFNGQHDYSFHIADQQALCSVISFIFGAFIGRIGDRIGCKTRMWLILGTFIQTIFTMIAAITLWKSNSGSVADTRGDPAWTNALTFVTLGFISACMGLQGIMGKRLNTQFTTTVVLTTTWCELMTEPQLFNFRRLVISRDHKVMAIVFLFLGGFISRALLDKIGSAATLGIGTALRFVITLWWLFVPANKPKS